MASKLSRLLVDAINAEFNGGAAIVSEGRARSEITKVVPTGIDAIDHYVIGCGGFPCGRMTELFSEEGGGKSSLIYAALAGAQRAGGTAILIESEEAFQSDRAAVFGVDCDDLVLIEAGPESLSLSIQDVLKRIESLGKTLGADDPDAGPVLVAWDSLAATPTDLEIANGVVGEEMASDRAKILSRACRSLAGQASKYNYALVVVNQTRTAFGGGWGSSDVTTPGGKAVKFYASLRLRIMGGAAVKNKLGEHIAKDITVIAPKNKMTGPWKKCRVRLNYATGFDNVWTIVSKAKDLKLIPKGARYSQAVADEVLPRLMAALNGEGGEAVEPEAEDTATKAQKLKRGK